MNPTQLLVPGAPGGAATWWPHGVVRLLGAAARHWLASPWGILAPLLALPLLLLV